MEAANRHGRPRTRDPGADGGSPTGAKTRARAHAHALALLFPVLGAALGVCACSQSQPPRAATPAKNEFRAENRAVRVELIRAEYHAEMVTLRIELSNRGDTPVRADPNAIFLAFDGLEYAPQPSPAREELPRVEVTAGAMRPIDLTYQLGRALSQNAELVLRDVRHGPSDAPDHWVDPLRLFVPAQPAVGPAAEG